MLYCHIPNPILSLSESQRHGRLLHTRAKNGWEAISVARGSTNIKGNLITATNHRMVITKAS